MQLTLLLGLAAAAQVRAQARLRLGAAGNKAFLVVSSPARGVVEYVQLPEGDVHPLIDHGLTRPQGIAVNGSTLYVADPGSQRIEAYELTVLEGKHLMARKYRTVLADVEAHSVAVDGPTIYYTDSSNKYVDAYDVVKQSTPKVLFDGENVATVAAPGGIALDGMDGLLWTNKAAGEVAGSLVSADLITKTTSVLAKNVDAAYGVCVSHSNVFYSASGTSVFGVKRAGGAPTPVSTSMTKPRGCVYDTDGTIYLADEGIGKVYAFPANAETLGTTELTPVAAVEQPYGLAYVYYDPAKHVKPSLMEKFMHWWNTQ